MYYVYKYIEKTKEWRFICIVFQRATAERRAAQVGGEYFAW